MFSVRSILGSISGASVLVLLLLFSTSAPAVAETVAEWERKDSPTGCDEIGWDAGELFAGSPDEEDLQYHASCVGSTLYLGLCGTLAGDGAFFEPASNQRWIACYILAGTGGTAESSVSPFDFSLVDSNGRKYQQDFTAQASLDANSMFPTATLREGQTVEGVIAFAVPTSSDLPYALEIDPLLNFSLTGTDPGYIVVSSLVPFSSLLP